MKILFVDSWRSEMIGVQRSFLKIYPQLENTIQQKKGLGTLFTVPSKRNRDILVCCEEDWKSILPNVRGILSESWGMVRFWFNQPSELQTAQTPPVSFTDIAFFPEFRLVSNDHLRIIPFAPESALTSSKFFRYTHGALSITLRKKILFVGEVAGPDSLKLRFGKRRYDIWLDYSRAVLSGVSDLPETAMNLEDESDVFGLQKCAPRASHS